MILCDKLSEENIRCSILLSNDDESIILHWNGEDFVGYEGDSELYREFDNSENIMSIFLQALEYGEIKTIGFKVKII